MKKDKLLTEDGNMFTVFYLGEKKSQIKSKPFPDNQTPYKDDCIPSSTNTSSHEFCCPVGPKGKAGVKGIPYNDEQKALMIWMKALKGGDQYFN